MGVTLVSQLITNQQRRVCKLVVIKRQSTHNREFNARQFQFLGHFRPLYLTGQLTLDRGKRGGMTCSKGPQVGDEPTATVPRTKPFYMNARSTR